MKKTTEQQWKISHILYSIVIMYFCLTISIAAEDTLNNIPTIRIPSQLFAFLSSFISTYFGALFLLKKYPINIHLSISTIKINRTTAGWGTLGGFLVSAIQFPYATMFFDFDVPNALFLETNDSKIYIALFLSLGIIFIPIVEELFFRACVYRILKNKFSMIWGYTGTTFLFVIMHPTTIFHSISYTLVSLVLTFLYEKTGDIRSSIFAHSVGNMTWFAAIYTHKIGLLQ